MIKAKVLRHEPQWGYPWWGRGGLEREACFVVEEWLGSRMIRERDIWGEAWLGERDGSWKRNSRGWVVVCGRRIVGKRDGSMFNLRDSKPNEVVNNSDQLQS